MALVAPQATGQSQAVTYSTPYYSGSEPLGVRQAFEQRGKRNQESEGDDIPVTAGYTKFHRHRNSSSGSNDISLQLPPVLFHHSKDKYLKSVYLPVFTIGGYYYTQLITAAHILHLILSAIQRNACGY